LVLAQHGVGSLALATFLTLCKIKWIECVEGGGKKTFLHFFNCLKILKLHYNILAFKIIDIEYEKLFSLINKKVNYLILTRDPFEIWTSYSNNRIRKESFNETINENDNLYDALNIFLYVSTWSNKPLMPLANDQTTWMQLTKNQIPRSCVFEASIMKYIKNCNNIYYIQTKDLNKDKAFETIKRISKKFNFKILNQPSIFQQQILSDLNIFFPRKIIFDNNKFIITIQTIYSSYEKHIFTDIKKDIYPKNGIFYDEIAILIENINLKYLDKSTNEKLIKYFNNFSNAIQNRIILEKQKRIKVENNLNVFNKPSKIRTRLKEIFDEEFKLIKKYRPDIVASWKYYQEFEKMCKELDA
ncbi:DUF2972 domain-containing protein, partial [Campylobacter molothri]|nr:DUF2972 domain-containing protein [Campylobacter sp. RM9930]